MPITVRYGFSLSMCVSVSVSGSIVVLQSSFSSREASRVVHEQNRAPKICTCTLCRGRRRSGLASRRDHGRGACRGPICADKSTGPERGWAWAHGTAGERVLIGGQNGSVVESICCTRGGHTIISQNSQGAHIAALGGGWANLRAIMVPVEPLV